MFNIAILILVFATYLVSASPNATAFCNTAPSGYYCDSGLTGFYRCSESTPQFQICPQGTNCACFDGPECQSVQTVGTGSPCDFIPALPKFPSAYVSTSTGYKFDSDHKCIRNKTISVTVFKSSNGDQRVDVKALGGYEFGSCYHHDQIAVSYYYIMTSSGSYQLYTYNKLKSSCSKTTATATVPPSQVPDGFRLLGATEFYGTPSGSVPAQSAANFYFRSGASYLPEPIVYEEITTSTPSQAIVTPLGSYRKESMNGATSIISTTIEKFQQVEPEDTFFNLPPSCVVA